VVKLCAFSIIGQFMFYFAMHAPHSPMPDERRIKMNPKTIETIARHITDFSLAGIRGIQNR
jgi:hypothetical protein